MSTDRTAFSKAELEAKARDIRGINDEHSRLIGDLSKLVNALPSGWNGTSVNAYVESFNGYNATFSKFTEFLEKLALFIDDYRIDMTQLDEAHARKFTNSL